MTPGATESGIRELLGRLRSGDRTALARAISLVENLRPGFEDLLHEVHRDLGRAERIGLTGPPGAGKSTLLAQLIGRYRKDGERVGVVAVDPSSSFTGGALLGDRIRLGGLATDPGVFIRSMATRGSHGGLATTSREVADLLEAFGFEKVIIESVGVGQAELDIAEAVDTTIVVLVPESGDSVQAMKAGLMEIADVFVVNKADRPGADSLAKEIEMMLDLRDARVRTAVRGDGSASAGARWSIPVLKVVAQNGEGVDSVLEALRRHREYLRESGEMGERRRARYAARCRKVVERRLNELAWRKGETILAEALPGLEAGTESPYSVSDRIVESVLAVSKTAVRTGQDDG